MPIPQFRWKMLESNSGLAIAQRILKSRQIDESDTELFLSPSFENHLHDPYLLKDMDKAVERISSAIKNNEKILVFGDYDADGVTSTALLYSFLKEINANCDFHIPHRLKDGYGITEAGAEMAHEKNVDLIITVDNGIAAIKAIERANQFGIDVVITDHHKQGDELPAAYAVVNPNRHDCPYPFKGISGVGVAYKVIEVLSKQFMDDLQREKFLKWNLDLVAMGTVADVMPLLDENRIFVYYGLKVITKTKRAGIRALLEKEANKNSSTVTIGYKLGPKINAAGRLEAADKALKLLLEESPEQAKTRAQELVDINHKRQDLTEVAVKEAENRIDKSNSIFIIESEDWHQGIIGLISARLTDKYYKPSMVFNYDPDLKIYKGSGRSPYFFDITKALLSQKSILEAGGGHRQACGCAIKAENYDTFKSAIREYANQVITPEDLIPEIEIDAEMISEQINLSTYEQIETLAPFGQSFPDPVFITHDLTVDSVRQVGFEGKHLLFSFKKNNHYYKGIAFRQGHLIKDVQQGDALDVVYSLSKNEWNGKSSAQLIIKDLKKVS